MKTDPKLEEKKDESPKSTTRLEQTVIARKENSSIIEKKATEIEKIDDGKP